LEQVFYVGTFKVITSQPENRGPTIGTLGILLNLISDLAIKSRGVFSDFPYPKYIVKMLLDMVGDMIDGLGHGNTQSRVNDLIVDTMEDLQNIGPRDCMDEDLWVEALQVLDYPSSPS
jgi:hypothetical protein